MYVMEITLENRDTQGLIAYIYPDVTAAVETAEWYFLGDGMVRECSLGGKDCFFETFSCYFGFMRNKTYVSSCQMGNYLRLYPFL